MRPTYKIITKGLYDPDVLTEWVLRPKNESERKTDIGYELIRTAINGVADTTKPAGGYPVTDLGADLRRRLTEYGERLYELMPCIK